MKILTLMNENGTVCTMRKWDNYGYKIPCSKNENKQHTQCVEMGVSHYSKTDLLRSP